MTRVGLIRLLVIAASIGALELACRLGLINHHTIVPPSQMASTLWALLTSGTINADIQRTLGVIALVIVLSVVLGFVAGLAIHALPRVREASIPSLPPITRYRFLSSIRC
jgi:NitT/TauT family transport system permease protein